MDSSDSTLYIQKIEELVYDNGDIITPSVLSAQLNIKVNYARSLIEQYVKDTRQFKTDDLGVTYVLIGTNQDGSILIEVIKEDELEERKGHLRSVISEHIYSVQKSKDIDLNSLAILESVGALTIREKPLLGSIVSPNAIKRTFKTKPVAAVSAIKKEDEEKATIKSNTKVDNNKQKQKNGGISSFLSKDANKPVSKSVFEAKPKPKNFMTSFLNKAPNKTSSDKKIEEVKKEVVIKEEIKPEVTTSTNVEEDDSKRTSIKIEQKPKHKLIDSDSDENVPPQKQAKQTPKPKARKKRTAKDKGSQAPKRRRIINQDNSDSDDIFASDNDSKMEDEDIVVSDHEAPPTKQLLPSKRKVRKAVSEMIQDDDGYFQTVNKFVYESASGDENDEKQNDMNDQLKDEENKEQKPNHSIQPKSQNNNTKKKNTSPPKETKKTKGKVLKPAQNQASIMSFFKKT